MNTESAQYIVAIADHKSLTEAARSLHISQPALSNFLKKLETKLGCKVFTRIGHRLYPTDAGEYLLEAARKTLEIMYTLDGQLQTLKSRAGASRFRIGMTINYGSVVLAQIFNKFSVEMPECELTLNTRRNASSVLEMLENCEIDFGFILTKDIRLPKNMNHKVIWTRELVLIAPEHPAFLTRSEVIPGANYPYLDLSLLANQPFVIYDDPLYQQIASDMFIKANITPKVIRVPSEDIMYTILRCGYGVAIHAQEPNGLDYPTYGAVDNPTPLTFYSPAKTSESVKFLAVWRGSETDTPTIKAALSAVANTNRVYLGN